MRRSTGSDLTKRLQDADLALAGLDPQFYAAYRKFAASDGVLEPKVRELILLSVNASCTVRDADAVRRHIKAAVLHGASAEDLLEVLELTGALGVHTLDVAIPMMEAAAASSATKPRSKRAEALRSKLTGSSRETRWSPFWEALLKLDPDLFQATMEFLEVPWQHGSLSGKVKEFIYIAIDGACTHLYGKGLNAHIHRARRLGATDEELMAVLRLVAGVGLTSTLELALPILIEETADSATASPVGKQEGSSAQS